MLEAAGHVGHGKTVLIKPMTGVNIDLLRAEQERGLTTDIGFAPAPAQREDRRYNGCAGARTVPDEHARGRERCGHCSNSYPRNLIRSTPS